MWERRGHGGEGIEHDGVDREGGSVDEEAGGGDVSPVSEEDRKWPCLECGKELTVCGQQGPPMFCPVCHEKLFDDQEKKGRKDGDDKGTA